MLDATGEAGGQCGELVQSYDWTCTSIGPMATWPQSLRTTVSLLLLSRVPMVLLWGEDGVMIYNDAYSVFAGGRHPQLLGSKVREGWPEVADFNDNVMRVGLSGRTLAYKDQELTLYRHGRPEQVWMNLDYSPVLDEGGRPAGVLCVLAETTERVQAERQRLEAEIALRAERDRVRDVIENMTEGFILLDREFRVLDINAEGLRLEQRPRDEIVGKTHWEVWPGTEHSPLGSLYKRAMADRTPLALEHRYVRPDQRSVWFDMRGYPAAEGMALFYRDVTARRDAEERLRASEEFNRRVLASSADCIKVLDLDGRLEFMSEGGLSGMEIEEFQAIEGVRWTDLWRGDHHTTALAAVEDAKRGGAARFQGAAPTLKGTARWWDVSVTPIQDAKGHPEKLLVVTRDITVAHQASEKLRTSEAELGRSNALLAAVMEAVPGVVFAKDRQGRMIAANRGTAELVGKPLTDIVGHTDLDYLSDRDQAEAVMANDRRVIARGQAETIEEVLDGPDGLRRTWLSTKAPFLDASGAVSGLVGISVDITHRKQAEERLRELNDTLEQQVEVRTRDRDRMWRLSTDVMLVADFQARIEAVNPAWTTLFGWQENELVGADFMSLVHPEDVAPTLAEVGKLAQGIKTLRFENRYRGKDGSYRWLSWTAVPDERFIHAVGRDVQAEKEAAAALVRTEEALRQSQKMEAVGQLTGGLAHDFNNLLAGISGSLELMQTRMSQGRLTDLDRYMSAAQGAAKRAAALTHRLLAFSRRQTLDPKPTDVNALVHGMEELIRRTVGPAIALEVVGAGGLWPALVDPPQLENALLNLCINARDAMPEGGRITIETANRWLDYPNAKERDLAPGQYLSLCVSDTGTGMSPDVIAKAFDPFFTTKPIGQGTGLGLSMIYGFVRQSGGQVRIHSQVGMGTTVCLYLPRHQGDVEQEDMVPDLSGAPRAEQGETVLIVDDEPTVRMLVTEVLEDLGYTAIEAADGPAGLKVLQSDVRIDLLVTDVGLPGGMNGRQMADAGRVKRPDLKVLFITGYAENAAVGSGHLEPGMAVLTKPFVMESLASRIRDMIEA